MKCVEGMGHSDFKASQLWVPATLKFNKKVGINLHGESNDIKDEESYIIMSVWRKYFHANILAVDTPP